MSALVSRARYDQVIAPVAESGLAARLLLDCTDLLEALARHATVTGIDRVQIRLLSHVMEVADRWVDGDYHLVRRSALGRVEAIDRPAARRFLEAASSPRMDPREMAAIAEECGRVMRDVDPRPGDVYFIVGAFWTASTSERHLQILKDKGVAIGAYIYDLIPMTHPQYCMAAHSRAFELAFAEVMPQLDFALTISEFVAAEVSQAMAKLRMPAIPVLAAPLAHQLEGETWPSEDGRQKVRDLVGPQPYVLCVGTIEIRKNHLYLVNVWQALTRENLEMPTLVFVGRLGWRVNDLIDQLQSLRYLNGKIKILNDVSDRDLADLYDNCLFTMFPSFVEGWGLPVGESLARGKVTVASSAASIPEVGGPHALYIDPYNLRTGIEVVRKLLTDANFYQVTEDAIRYSFRARSWDAAGETFLSCLARGYEARPPARAFAPALPSGSSLLLSDLVDETVDIDAYMEQPLRLVLHNGWRPIDHGGSWILDRTASVRFDTKCAPGTIICVAMTFVTVPWLRDSALIISGDSGSPPIDQLYRNRRVLFPSCMFRHSVKVCVGEGGIATLRFEIEGDPRNNPPEEMAVLWIRMLTIGWCSSADLDGRLALLEEAIWS